jgi:CSLREA domain-containing protein
MTATKVGAVVATTLAAGFAMGGSTSAATTFTVDKLADTSDGSCTPGNCSLRDAIDAANADATADTIVFGGAASSGMISLTLGQLPTIIHPVTITGPGAAALTVQGVGTHRIFYIDASSATFDVTISGLTLTHDSGTVSGGGGAIYNNTGHLTVSDAVITGIKATGKGGGIFSAGNTNSLDLENTTVSNNETTGSGGGGGGVNVTDGRAQLKVINSTVTGNKTDLGYGGGLYFYSNTGVVYIDPSTITNNTSHHGGGGAWLGGEHSTGTLKDSTVSGNTTQLDGGGGLYFYTDSVDIENSTITGNTAHGSGGGLYFDESVNGITIANTTVSNNTASTFRGGGMHFYDTTGPVNISNTVVTGNTADDEGGGMDFYYTTAPVHITTSTIAGNTASDGGGGVYVNDDEGGSPGAFTFQDSTISGNTAGHYGGGLYLGNLLTTAHVLNSTISGNTATQEGGGINFNGYYGLVLTQDTITNNTAAHYGGLYLPHHESPAAKSVHHDDAQAVKAADKGDKKPNAAAHKASKQKGPHAHAELQNKYANDGETTSTGTIIAGNHGASGSKVDVGPGSVVHSDHSLFGLVGPFTTIDDKGGTQVNTDPVLGPLQNNGGPTDTHALLPGSPAINAGPVPSTISTDQVGSFDQRGAPYNRVSGGAIDIGANEVQVQEVIITPAFTG